ncbi:MAG: 2Fe-2S iron-sulfur cluster-binding protein [Bacteroidetes bacterium]|nr:2Fe-2S iron-sulfur cluster-binding protein [Bacteroidota bacterium]
MVKLTIDHIPVEVQEGISVMDAAATFGITIPSLCFLQGLSNHPSCMICLVKDLDRGHLVPSCAMPVSDGMNILTGCAEVLEARKEALELLLSDHVGDCEAPCRISCPAFMDIPLMNRLIGSGNFEQALSVVREEIALPMVLGYICPAPCEKACKRKQIDQPVSVCLLKRATAQYEIPQNDAFYSISLDNRKKVAIIGTGPAGLAAAFSLLSSGHACVLYDQHEKAGGTLQYDIPDEHLPRAVLDAEIAVIRKMGAEFRLGITVTREIFRHSILPAFDAVILATGTMLSDPATMFGLAPDEHGTYIDKKTFSTSLPGVFAGGNIIREQKMAVHSVAQGKMAAKQVEIYLGTQHPGTEGESRRKSVSATGPLFEPEWNEYLKESSHDQRTIPAGGISRGFTREEAIHEAKRCLRCDCRKPVSCKLRMYAETYGAGRKRFTGPERKILTKSFHHEFVVYETEKCIRCGLCVEITEKQGESVGLTFAGRGFDVRISVPFNQTTREALTSTAKLCVESCPTGALAFKDQEERKPL